MHCGAREAARRGIEVRFTSSPFPPFSVSGVTDDTQFPLSV